MSLRLPIAFLFLLLPCHSQPAPSSDADRIRQLISQYAAAVDAGDAAMAAKVWDTSTDVSFIHPLGHAHGWDQVKLIFTDLMGGTFSERKLTPRDIQVHVYGDAAWAEFYWHFTATQRKDGVKVQTDGRETQIYRKSGGRWLLVHVHYSAMPPAQ
jgi:uncharacterized protein (TIGR02246 family)